MKIYVNGELRELTQKELNKIKQDEERALAEYWRTVDYGEAINAEIRKKYSISEEFAILRQKEEKPLEYSEYYAYCEECKSYVKDKKGGLSA